MERVDKAIMLRAMLDNGMSRQEIAKEVGMHYVTVCRILRDHFPDVRSHNWEPFNYSCIYCGTPGDDLVISYKDGVKFCNMNCHYAFFKNDKLFAIQALRDAGYTQTQIGWILGTYQSKIGRIVSVKMESKIKSVSR